MTSIRLSGTFVAVAFALTLVACSSGDSPSITSGNSSPPPPPPPGGSGTAALTWNGPSTNANSTDLDDLAGYRVYQSTTSGTYNAGPVATVVAPSTGGGIGIQYTVTGLASGTYYFVVRAYDTSGNESANALPSEVSKIIP